MPEITSLESNGMSESNQAVLFLLIVDVKKPSAVQFTLSPRILPGVGDIREQVLRVVAFPTIDFMPTWQ